MSRTTWIGLCSACAAIVVGVWVLSIDRGREDGVRAGTAQGEHPTESAKGADLAQHDADPASGGGRHTLPTESTQSVPEPEEPPDDESSGTPDRDTLRSQLEATLHGHIDPGAFLDLALQLADLEVEQRAVPSPDAAGTLRYPIEDAPAGMKAELWLQHSVNPEFENPVMSFGLALDEQDGPYVLEGAARRPPQVQLTVWHGPDGKLKNFAILTQFRIDGASRKLGLPIDHGKIPTGMHFTFDAARPTEFTATVTYLENGSPVDRPVIPTITGGPWPRIEDLEALNAKLLKSHDGLKAR